MDCTPATVLGPPPGGHVFHRRWEEVTVATPPCWEASPLASYAIHKFGQFIEPDFVWRLQDAPGCDRVPTNRGPWPQECSDMIYMGFCHVAHVYRWGPGATRTTIKCEKSEVKMPPAAAVHIEHVLVLDPAFGRGHWQHTVLNTLPQLGMAALILQQDPNVTVVHNGAMLDVADISLEPLGTFRMLNWDHFSINRSHREYQIPNVVFPFARRGSYKKPIVKRGTSAVLGRISQDHFRVLATSRVHTGLVDSYSRSSYWPFWQLLPVAVPPRRLPTDPLEIVFISRPPPMARALWNERLVVQRLRTLFGSQRYDFTVVNTSRPPAYFECVHGLIGVHGAAFANTYRMQAGARAVEIHSYRGVLGYEDARLGYAVISQSKGVDHRVFFADSFPSNYEAKPRLHYAMQSNQTAPSASATRAAARSVVGHTDFVVINVSHFITFVARTFGIEEHGRDVY